MQSRQISLRGVVSVAFFSVMLFGVASVAHAEDPCLRGGNGNCVALTKEVNTPGAVGQVFAENMLDSAASHNVVTLKDGTLVAAVARANDKNSTVFTRYIIELWVSKDGGVTWSLPGIQQPWYVDQVNITHRTSGGDQTGAGFLGFSLAASERTTGTYLFLAHSLVCRGTVVRGADLDVATSCSIPSGNNNWESVSTVALETLSYDSATNSFGTAAPTKNVSTFGTTATGCWGITACFGLGYGADHPNVWASSATTNVVISFSAYRGDSCTAVTCPGQTGVNGPASVGLYILHDMFNGTHSFDTPGLFDCANTSCKPSEFVEAGGIHAEEHAFYSMLTGPTDAFRPVVAFGFSDKGRPEAVLGMRFYNGAAWQVVSPQVVGATIYATANSSVGTPQKKMPQFSLVMSNTEYAFQPSGPGLFTNKYVHMVVMADQVLLNGKSTAMPYYLKFEITQGTPWSINPAPMVIELADPSTEGTYRQFNKTASQAYQAYIESGGPTIGFSAQNLYIAFPAAPIMPATSFTAANAHVYYVRLRSNIIQAQSSTAPKYRWDSTVTLDTESGDPIYARMTAQNDASPRGFATPALPQFLYYRNESYSPTSLSNVFNPPMLFVHNTANALSAANITSGCSATNPCAAAFSGEPQTRGIRSWGWASTVGWISLSCDNLQTCYHKYSPYSLIDDGGYYGVRVVVNPKVTQTPVIGRMWSDRVGYISFDRKDSIHSLYNPCGNPPSGFTRTANTCALLGQDIDDTSVGPIDLVPGNQNGFAASGYVMIDNEIVSYSSKGVDSLTISGRGISGARYSQPARAHAASTVGAPTPIYFISAANPTADGQVSDIYAGMSLYNPSSLEITGWGRALEWKRYQESYCGTNIGSSYAPPCDKEWGWIKFNGKWQTVNRGTFISAGSCGTTSLNASSVDGYPDPTGTNEKLRIAGLSTTFEYAAAIDQTNRRFTLTGSLPAGATCTSVNGRDVVWIADLASNISVGATTISLTSINGLISAGSVEVVRAVDDVVMTTVVYQKIDETAKQLTNLTFDAAFAPPYTAGTYYVRQKKDTGNYNTFGIPFTATSAEVTLGGFAWSSPNTDSPVADPFGSRYRNNISGFGWINFQPNKLDLLYPYLRTLFSDVYASSDIILNPPSASLSPSQFTSTYLIQKTGDILPFSGNPLVTAGAVAKCVQACVGNVTCETACRDNLVESLTAPTVPNIKPFSGDSQGLGKLPNYDDLADMVSDCKRYDSTTSLLVDVACPTPAEAGRKRANNFDGNYTVPELQLFKNDAVVGKNKFGNRVVLCRMDPNIDMGSKPDLPWTSMYMDNGYNPPECVWKDVDGWKAIINSYTAAPPSLCISSFQSYNNSEIPTSGYIKDPANGVRIAYSGLTLGAAPCAAGQTKIDLVSVLSANPASGTTLEESPIVTFKRINPNATSDTASKEATVYIVPDDYGISGRFVSFTSAFLQADNGIVVSGQTTSGAVMLMFPGSVFYNDGQMRYCSSAPEGMRCTSGNDATNQNITNIRQLASVAWYSKGSWQSWLSPFASFYPAGKLTQYHIGAIIVTGENPNANALFNASPGTFSSTITLLFRGMQFQLSGLLVAKNIDFNSEYITQDPSTSVVNEPSENITYDGRAIANPPPGMSDLVIGLPKIEKITP